MKKVMLFLAAAAMMAACCNKQEVAQVDPAETVMQNILSRKSVRSYTGDTIPAATLENILRAAQAAPSGRDWRPWSFVVVTPDQDLEVIFGDNFNMRMYKEAGAIVILCADPIPMGPPRDNPAGPDVAQVNHLWRDDLGAATENLLLAVEAYGLGACWTACYPYPERMDPIRAAVGLPPTVVPYAVVPIGVPSGDTQPKDKWDPERVHYNRW